MSVRGMIFARKGTRYSNTERNMGEKLKIEYAKRLSEHHIKSKTENDSGRCA